MKNLNYKLNQLREFFDFEKIVNLNADIKSIAKYYKVNVRFYSFLNNRQGFIHMAISQNKKLTKEDYLGQIKIIERYINKNTKTVLELATGRGANSIYLANKYSKIQFVGIDLPNGHLNFAAKNSKGLNNFKPEEGDFHDLSKYPKKSFDIVFIIEALCHSNQKEKVIKQVKRV